MSSSSGWGKLWIAEELNFLKKNIEVNRVLDLAAGCGTYYAKFHKQLKQAKWTAIEVWKKYIDEFRLQDYYNFVINSDLRKVDFANLEKQDIVFAGDVLEHMTKPEAVDLVNSILKHHRVLVVSIPVEHSPQDEVDGNPFERHVKDDWSDQEMRETFPDIVKGAVDRDIGVYVLTRDSQILGLYQRSRPNQHLQQYERKVFSQNGEDGIIEYILSQIGITNRVAVEIGVSGDGGGRECNSRLLVENGWQCYWFDKLSIEYVAPNLHFSQEFLTADTVNNIFQSLNIPQEFDLLSIDIDSNDWYLREALKNYRPRMYIMEYNGSFLSDESYIMPRNDQYSWRPWDTKFGASLKALHEQAQRLGYDLVYCDTRGVNAFFVRQDLNKWAACQPGEAWNKLWWAYQDDT